jgi:hypothetical protein
MKGGNCYEVHKQKQKERLEENMEMFANLHLQIKEMAIDAIRVLGEAIKNGNVGASVKVLDLVGIEKYINYQSGYEDDGVSLLRRIIEGRRLNAKTPK